MRVRSSVAGGGLPSRVREAALPLGELAPWEAAPAGLVAFDLGSVRVQAGRVLTHGSGVYRELDVLDSLVRFDVLVGEELVPVFTGVRAWVGP